MKTLIIILAAVAVLFVVKRLVTGKVMSPSETATHLASPSAVLVDVREPSEWAGGVIEGAQLLPLSDLRGSRTQWTAFLEQNKGSEIVLYCRSGARSGVAAKLLESEGFRTSNAGGFSDLKAAGRPVRVP